MKVIELHANHFRNLLPNNLLVQTFADHQQAYHVPLKFRQKALGPFTIGSLPKKICQVTVSGRTLYLKRKWYRWGARLIYVINSVSLLVKRKRKRENETQDNPWGFCLLKGVRQGCTTKLSSRQPRLAHLTQLNSNQNL